MNWYKLAQDNSFTLSKTIAQWLIQAFYGPVDMQQVHQDLNSLMPKLDDERALNEAMIAGETLARTQLHLNTELTQTQQDLLNNIRLRLSNPQVTQNVGELENVQSNPPLMDAQISEGENYVEVN